MTPQTGLLLVSVLFVESDSWHLAASAGREGEVVGGGGGPGEGRREAWPTDRYKLNVIAKQTWRKLCEVSE